MILSLTIEKTCYKAVHRAVVVVASVDLDVSSKEKLDTIVRGTARSFTASASLVLLDATKKKLIHVSSWALPQIYLKKGVLDADKSLSEVLTGKPVVIIDVAK